MTEGSGLESRFDAFLFAPVGESNELTLSVLSILARHDVDPWEEAARLTQLPSDQAVNSLALKIWKSNSERWSATEASILAARLIQLLPSHGRPAATQISASDGTGGLAFWVTAAILFMSLAISGHGTQNSTKDAIEPAHEVSMAIQDDVMTRSPPGIGTD
jgi:hypothetical protein